MKGGLRDAPLAQPEFILARQQAVAERHPQLVVERTLVIVARVVLQDMTNVRGVRDEVATSRADLEVDDVAEATSGTHEHGRRIAPDRRQHAEDRKPARARWKRSERSGWLVSSSYDDYTAGSGVDHSVLLQSLYCVACASCSDREDIRPHARAVDARRGG